MVPVLQLRPRLMACSVKTQHGEFTLLSPHRYSLACTITLIAWLVPCTIETVHQLCLPWLDLELLPSHML